MDADTGNPSERSIDAIVALCRRFLKSSEEVLISDYVNPEERWGLTRFLELYFDIESDPSNCLDLRIPLWQLMFAVYGMRRNIQLQVMSSDQRTYSGSYYDYGDASLFGDLSPRLELAGTSLSNAIVVESVLSVDLSAAEQMQLAMMRIAIFRSHSRDLLEAVVTTIQKYR